MEQRIRFCKTPNAERMAYAVTGEGPPLLITPGWVSHLQVHWDGEGPRRFWERLSQNHTVIRYDKPGTGLSDRDAADVGPEARVTDLEALVEHLGLDRFRMFGWSEGGPMAVAYAARHADNVERLVLYGTFTKWFFPPENLRPIVEIVRGQWGVGSAALTALFVPSNSPDQVAYFTELQRLSASPETAAQMLETNRDIDVRHEATRIACPTLVMHREDDLVCPVDEGRKTASLIPDSNFVLLHGDDHLPWWGDSEAILRHTESFLGVEDGKPDQKSVVAGTVRTVLFTDLVGHTEMMSRLGDEGGRDVLREHERITREILAEHDGTEVKTMGDGFMASFGSVTKAVECAIELQRAFAERGGEPLSVRVGLNAGEPIEEDGDLFGATVILASRITTKAEGGEILVADTVRGLCSGKGFLFADRGEFAAKGFEDPVRVYEVRWREGA